MSDWDSGQYMKFKNERTRPAIDLISRIDRRADRILDIGCGPGNSTARLFEKFPDAEIIGIDSSENMLEKAKSTYPQLKFQKCFVPDELDVLGSFDIIFSNACLHWIAGHDRLLPELMNHLNANGVLAVQMPLVQRAPFYIVLGELTKSDRWRCLSKVNNFNNLLPEPTYDILSGVSSDVTMWETVYYHIMDSQKDVIEWYKGSGLRPYLDLLNEDEKQEFLRELEEKIKDIFPRQRDGRVILKMPRMFFIAAK